MRTDDRKIAAFAIQPGESLKGKGLEVEVLSVRVGTDYGYGAPLHVTLRVAPTTETIAQLEAEHGAELSERERARAERESLTGAVAQ